MCTVACRRDWYHGECRRTSPLTIVRVIRIWRLLNKTFRSKQSFVPCHEISKPIRKAQYSIAVRETKETSATTRSSNDEQDVLDIRTHLPLRPHAHPTHPLPRGHGRLSLPTWAFSPLDNANAAYNLSKLRQRGDLSIQLVLVAGSRGSGWARVPTGRLGRSMARGLEGSSRRPGAKTVAMVWLMADGNKESQSREVRMII